MEFLSHLLPDTLSKKITLAWCDIDVPYPENVLMPLETKAYTSFKNPRRRQEYLATRWLIRQMTGQMEMNDAAFKVQKDDLGKPYGSYQQTTYHLSIAHTQAHVMCAISMDKAIGIDLEPAGRDIPERLRNRILHPSEQHLLKQIETLRIWTLKEALVKLQGQGMRMNLNECIITIIDGHEVTAKFNDDKSAKICSFAYENNWLAIAYNL